MPLPSPAQKQLSPFASPGCATVVPATVQAATLPAKKHFHWTFEPKAISNDALRSVARKPFPLRVDAHWNILSAAWSELLRLDGSLLEWNRCCLGMETDSAVAWTTSLGRFTAPSMIAYSYLIAPSSIPLAVWNFQPECFQPNWQGYEPMHFQPRPAGASNTPWHRTALLTYCGELA